MKALENSTQLQQFSILNSTTADTSRKYWSASWASYIVDISFVESDVSAHVYSIFGFQPPQNLFLGVSKLLQVCMIQDISSNVLQTKPSGPRGNPRLFTSIRTSLICECNTLLSEFEKYYIIHGMKDECSKHEGSSQLNVLFLHTSLGCMLEGKYCIYLDLSFLFLFSYASIYM